MIWMFSILTSGNHKGNHAQALAVAASTFQIPAYIVMPTISTPSKIAGTKSYSAEVIFSGSTSDEREAVTQDVIKRTGAIYIPPYDHPDIILGQGTTALEMEEQVRTLVKETPELSVHHKNNKDKGSNRTTTQDNGSESVNGGGPTRHTKDDSGTLDAVLVPLGGGGLLSGICTHFDSPPNSTKVFGAEPSYQGADDARRGLSQDPPSRIPTVKTLTIADGLRTPVGQIPWSIISDKQKCAGVFAVTEDQIKAAMRLVLERMKVFIEPSGAVGLAVVLFDEGWRKMCEEDGGWDVGVVFSGGNTTVEAIVGLFGEGKEGARAERQEGKVGLDGQKVAENVPG